MRKYLLVVMVMVVSSAIANPQQWKVTVTKVIDGNTLEIMTEGKDTFNVVLKDIDCPEIGQQFGDEAKKLTEKFLLKKNIIILVSGKDRWGNRLVDVTLSNGKDINEELLKNGYAWHNTKLSSSAKLKSLETGAKNQKKGLWENDNPTPPWIFRRQQTMMVAKSR